MAILVLKNVDISYGDAGLGKEFVYVPSASDISDIKKDYQREIAALKLEIKRLKNKI